MGNLMRAVWTAVVWGVCAAGAMAQTLTVPKNLTAGRSTTITYSDPGRAGQSITITIDNASSLNPIEITLEVMLDGNGNGSVEWTVPEWMAALFNAPGVHEISRDIDIPDVPIF